MFKDGVKYRARTLHEPLNVAFGLAVNEQLRLTGRRKFPVGMRRALKIASKSFMDLRLFLFRAAFFTSMLPAACL